MLSAMRKLQQMRGSDRSILLVAACLLPLCRVALRGASLRRVQAALNRTVPAVTSVTESEREQAIVRVREIARLVNFASRHTAFAPTCLHRSLTLWWLLRRRRFDAVVRFGIRKRDGRFEAHAWVEYAGTVINDPEAAAGTYSELPLVALRTDV